MTAVWVVRPPVMTLQWPVRYFNEENIAREVLKSHHEFGIESTITRETLLTPAHAAVIGTVKQFLDIYNNETVSDPNAAAWAIGEMECAVATLRELET